MLLYNSHLSSAVFCTEYFVRVLFDTDMEHGLVGDMQQLGVTESFRVKQQSLISGAEAAEMILRVANILKSAPRQRHPDYRPC